MDRNYDADDVIKAVEGEIGRSNILGCVKVVGQWVITLSNDGDAELLQGTGLLIKEDVCEVIGVGRSFVTVSFFDVPTFVNDEDLSAKLIELGCDIKSPWTRKHYAKFPHIENGIRYVRLQLPNKKKSLPYAITVGGIHLRLKHNGQTKVCNNCLSEGHIMRNCPDYKCKNCDLQGHRESRCPKTQCYKCHQFGHKSFQCHGDKCQQNEDDLNYPVEQMEAENLEANVEETENVSQTIDNQNSEIGEQNTSSLAVTQKESTPRQRELIGKTTHRVAEQDIYISTPNRKGNPDQLPLLESRIPIPNGKTETDKHKVKDNPNQPLKRTLSIDEDGFSQVTPNRSRRSAKKKIVPNLTNARNGPPKDQPPNLKSK